MDELRGPNIQIVLHVKEGQGFGFLSCPFLVSGSLNGYTLETDPVVPSHSPVFDSELVWEADKRRFRNLRIQNVPVKVEVYSTATQGRKTKIGYLLISLLAAQPCPSHKTANIKDAWHKLLGVKPEGQCCHPQLLLSLTIQDWINTPTPRNQPSLFHSNETTVHLLSSTTAPVRPLSLTLGEYLAESKKTVTSPELAPRLLTQEGLIQIGNAANKHLFVLSFVIGTLENVDTIIPDTGIDSDHCLVKYSVFTHTIETDKFPSRAGGVKKTSVQFNQRTSLRLCTDLQSLGRYYSECPHVVTQLFCGDRHVGICSTDLRKLVPTEDVKMFLTSFCNADRAITIGERCFLLSCVDGSSGDGSRKPFIDIEISLRYVGKYRDKNAQPPNSPATRSTSHLGCPPREQEAHTQCNLDRRKSNSCNDVKQEQTNKYTTNSARAFRNESEDTILKGQNEIAEMIKKMYETFTSSKELLSVKTAPATADMNVQCSPDGEKKKSSATQVKTVEMCGDDILRKEWSRFVSGKMNEEKPVPPPPPPTLSAHEREVLMKKCVEELEDWKEKKQELFKHELKRKEEYHLQLLSEEWNKRQSDLEARLSKGIEQCRALASDLSKATNGFRQRAYNVVEKEKKLVRAKDLLEEHYSKKFHDLREASQKMEDDMKHQVKLKDLRLQELQTEIEHLEKTIKNNAAHDSKNAGLTKDQTAGLIQELRILEDKLAEALQSKAFFKEQWGRAVRELHALKLRERRQVLAGHKKYSDRIDHVLENELGQLTDADDSEEILANLMGHDPSRGDGQSKHNISGDELFGKSPRQSKKQVKDKLKKIMEQRDRMMRKESSDEEKLTKLNNEIRNILLNSKS